MATTETTTANLTVKITMNDRGNPPGKLADAELIFEADAGPQERLLHHVGRVHARTYLGVQTQLDELAQVGPEAGQIQANHAIGGRQIENPGDFLRITGQGGVRRRTIEGHTLREPSAPQVSCQ